MADGDAELPRWGGVTEPTTVATNVMLAVLAFVLAARLAHRSAAGGSTAKAWFAAALFATGFSALIGAVAHGTSPDKDASLRGRLWSSTLYVTGLIGAATIASVAYFAASGYWRNALLLFAVVKLVVYVRSVARQPVFQIAAVDYGVALAILLIGAVTELVRRRAGMAWLIAGVLVSLVAGLVQARRVALHRQFNHNDLFHVIQMVALYAFYRGGALLIDR